jgi:hypothetical protein
LQEDFMRDHKTTLVLTPPDGDHQADWSGQGAIVLSNFSLLDGALHAGVTEYGREVSHVILDRSVDAPGYLDFLTRLPLGFRGDVLLILEDGSGYLSAVSRDDGRYLYRLTATDIRFYREAAFAEPSNDVSFRLPARPISSARLAS